MCVTGDLGIMWPQWHTLILEGQVRVNMRFVCPKDVKKMLLKHARRKQRKSGLKNIETLPENWSWKEAGCRKDSSTLVGRMKVSAKLVTRRKAQRSTGFTIAQNGTWSDGRSQRLAKRYCNAPTQ